MLNLELHKHIFTDQGFYITAGVCAVLASALAVFQIFKHLQYYTEPQFQRYIIRIIFMVPVYSLVSFFLPELLGPRVVALDT